MLVHVGGVMQGTAACCARGHTVAECVQQIVPGPISPTEGRTPRTMRAARVAGQMRHCELRTSRTSARWMLCESEARTHHSQ